MIIDSRHELVQLLGLPLGSAALVSALRGLGELRERRFPGRNNLLVVAESHGLELKLKPAGELAGESMLGVAPDQLVAAVLFFHSPLARQGRGYTGTLPYDLKFELSRPAARELLGPPAASSSLYANDRWQRGPLYLTLDFSDDERRIQQVCVGLVWKEER